jgi:DTW domain-containing protein YfiP
VSGISRSWKGGRVLRLNTAAEVNRSYAEQIGVKDTPTFILFDGSGREQRRWVREAPELTELP